MSRNASVVRVSDVHLKEGAPNSESWCALAMSLREELRAGLNGEVEVTVERVSVVLPHGSWWAETTPELLAFIRAFDAAEDPASGRADPEKLTALLSRASAGELAFPLTWREGEPPGAVDD